MRAEQECVLTDWDRFAAQEYDILAAEEDQEGSIRDESNALAGEHLTILFKSPDDRLGEIQEGY